MLDMPIHDPGRYALEIRIMREMGWSWRDLQDSPADLVEELQIRMNAESRWLEQRRKLDAQIRHGKS